MRGISFHRPLSMYGPMSTFLEAADAQVLGFASSEDNFESLLAPPKLRAVESCLL